MTRTKEKTASREGGLQNTSPAQDCSFTLKDTTRGGGEADPVTCESPGCEAPAVDVAAVAVLDGEPVECSYCARHLAAGLPPEVYFHVYNHGAGWYAGAAVSAERGATLEAWRAGHPRFAHLSPELNSANPASPFYSFNWRDQLRHADPVAAFESIVRMVARDVRPPSAESAS